MRCDAVCGWCCLCKYECFRLIVSNRTRGAMDSASDFGSEGWGFESLRVQPIAFLPLPTVQNSPRKEDHHEERTIPRDAGR